MKIEKLPSGTYRVRKTSNGKTYSMLFDHKPTQKDIESAYIAKINSEKTAITDDMTFRTAAERYIYMKENVLKPNTLREYKRTVDRLSEWFVDTRLFDITQIHINKQINELAVDRSPKTVRNYHGFIYSVITTFRPDMNINTTLPQKKKKEPYIPTNEEIKKILDKLQGTEFYIPVVLASYGMRRGEICALTANDVEGDVIHITKSLAYTHDKKWIVDTPKTTESNRSIVVPMEIANQIREKGYAYQGHPNHISKKLGIIEKELGIEHFSLHKLRHYFASTLSANNVPEADILALGGWETDYVMKNIYRHAQKEDKAKRDAMSKINNALF